ncbi:hypothetical protein ACIREO_23820 [Streptomyces sp. NPDC102441]|uniref:hypothetical protein n=1 Tax=Streptomyces sp. NPDC102441 TaxID=3366176 RepID=UPI00380CF071
MDKLIEGLIWHGTGHGSNVKITNVSDRVVTFEVSAKLNDGPDYDTSNWGFKGTLNSLPEAEFRKRYGYAYYLNLDHEAEVAQAHVDAATALLMARLNGPNAADLIQLFAKTVLSQAAHRISVMEWDTGCCGMDSDNAAAEITPEFSISEATLLHR